MRKRYHGDGCGKGSLFSGRAAAQHDDADGSHQQGQTGDDQAPVVFVKQGTAQQGGVREFSVVYLLTDGGAFRIEVGGTLGRGGRMTEGAPLLRRPQAGVSIPVLEGLRPPARFSNRSRPVPRWPSGSGAFLWRRAKNR